MPVAPRCAAAGLHHAVLGTVAPEAVAAHSPSEGELFDSPAPIRSTSLTPAGCLQPGEVQQKNLELLVVLLLRHGGLGVAELEEFEFE